jgi:hypothetical protein
MTNRETFIAHYERELHAEYDNDAPWLARLAANPPDRPRSIPELALRITNGLVTGGANKDSAPIKRTCKALGIKHTYTAIREYVGT